MKKLAVLLFTSVMIVKLLLPLSALSATANVSAHHAVLYEPTTETFLYEKDAHTRVPMASTTKIMTALVALESGDIDAPVIISEESCGIEGSSIYMQPGEKLTLRELLYALLLQSANDAAAAIAIHVSGSIEQFAERMNEKAVALGLKNTHFTNPHGLDHKEHFTTAHDLSIIAATALTNPTFKEIVSTVKHTIPGREDGDVRVLINHNKLLRLYNGTVGVKTGFTKKSGRCLVGAAEKDGLLLISVTLNAPNDWNDHIRMFEQGFSKLENRCLCQKNAFVYELPIIGKGGGCIRCTNKDAIHAVLPVDAPTPQVELDLPHYIADPTRNGRAIGRIIFKIDQKIIAEGTLVLTNTI